MKDRRRRNDVTWYRFFLFTVVVVLSCVLFSCFTFSTFRRLLFGASFHPVLGSTRRTPMIKAISGDSSVVPVLSIRDTVTLPDQVVVFLNYPPSARLFTKEDLCCTYLSANSSEPKLRLSPVQTDGESPDNRIVRCPIGPRGLTVSLVLKSGNIRVPPGPTHMWDSLVYEALIDGDNTTIVFVKGLNLRPAKVYNASIFECVYGWDFRKSKLLIRSQAISAAQEILRCRTPLSVLNSQQKVNGSIKVSIRVKGRGVLHSAARLGRPRGPNRNPVTQKPHEMCICTMVYNQARFLKEWVMYHAGIGVQRWYIYDNNSDDDIDSLIESLLDANYNISRRVWPWIKAQEAGFAHCALRARDSCDWVGFIDVDEFFHLKSGLMFHDVLEDVSLRSTSVNSRTKLSKYGNIGEIRVSCYSFGPSGLKHVPEQGITVGYTCRMLAPERHKSIIRPEALNSSLINVVHHFHLRDGFRFMNMYKGVMVVNHYKYQVWEVFKQKFHRRVATYVADWQDEKNVRSKDRAPGLGTRAIEPQDWSNRFCEVRDTGLRDRVLQNFVDPRNHLLPWQEGYEDWGQAENNTLVDKKARRKSRRRQNYN
ncbi:hypothetical protein SLE2022_194350 [Rubroshorea leprosula]